MIDAAESAVHKTVVSVKGLHFSYGEHEVLHDIAVEARQGEVIGLLGAV